MSMFSVFCPLLCGIQVKNIQEHLKSCKNKKYLNKYYFQCPYNPNHISSKNVFPIHKQNCPDKIESNEISSSTYLSNNANNASPKNNKTKRNYSSDSFPKKKLLKFENSNSKVLTEENNTIDNKNIELNKSKSEKIIKNLTPKKNILNTNNSDNVLNIEEKNLLKSTPIKIEKDDLNLNHHIDIESKKEIKLKASLYDKKKRREKINSKNTLNNKFFVIGKLKRKLNFDFDNEINDEKEGSITSEKTDTSSESSLKNIKKNVKRIVNFQKTVKVFVYLRNDENKKKENSNLKDNSNSFIDVYTKFL